VRYTARAAAAEAAGFRPCLRCRPEAAPGTPGWRGTSAVVQRALRLIEEGALNDASVEALATRVGLGARHLDRLFLQHVGASPLAIAQRHRLSFARELLAHSDLSMTEIALTAGFGSLRRFNHAFRTSHACTPSELRMRGTATELADADVVLKLAFRPPYDWTGVCNQLAAHVIPGVERVDASGYARVVAIDAARHAVVYVRPADGRIQAGSGARIDGEDALELRVSGAKPTQLLPLSTTARRVFDLAADPASIAAALAGDPLLAPLARGRPGLRVAGAWSPFECAVGLLLAHRGIQSWQDAAPARASESVQRGSIARLVECAGRPIAGGVDGLTHVFPSPTELARAPLGELGLGRGRAAALRALAQAVLDRTVDFDAPVEDVFGALSALPGFDACTVQRFGMRALGDPDAFPAAPFSEGATVHADASSATLALAARAEAWRPWRSYAAVLLAGLHDEPRHAPRIRSDSRDVTRAVEPAHSAR
jgi:AraC family transcriptional regulator of adaptative response / DNA-3-methyladenine glycosylase II